MGCLVCDKSFINTLINIVGRRHLCEINCYQEARIFTVSLALSDLSASASFSHSHKQKKNRESQECSFPFLISRAWELSWDTKDLNCFCRVGGFSGYHGHKKSKGSESGELKERSFTVPPLLSPRPFSYPQLLCSKVSYKRCLDCSEKPSQTFFFFFLFLLRDESDLTRIIFHHLHSVFCFFSSPGDATYLDIFREFSHMASHNPEKLKRRSVHFRHSFR